MFETTTQLIIAKIRKPHCAPFAALLVSWPLQRQLKRCATNGSMMKIDGEKGGILTHFQYQPCKYSKKSVEFRCFCQHQPCK